MKTIRVASAAFQDWPGIRSRRDSNENAFLRAPDLLDVVGVKIAAQLRLDNVGSTQQCHFAQP